MIHGIGDQLHFDGQSAHDLRTSALVQRSAYGRGCDRLEGLRLLKRFVEAFDVPIKHLAVSPLNSEPEDCKSVMPRIQKNLQTYW